MLFISWLLQVKKAHHFLCKSRSYVCLCTKRAANVDLIAQSAAVFF
jgi:hypothetical protein